MSKAESRDTRVEATWAGPFAARITLADGQVVDAVPGETVCLVGHDEAFESANWEPVKGVKAPKAELKSTEPEPEPAADTSSEKE